MRARVFPLSFELEPPLVNARGVWRTRRGLTLVLEDARGLRGVGECTPLPGFGRDALDACRAALDALDADDLARTDDAALALPVAARLERARQLAPVATPAARFALESAWLDLWARRAGVPAWAWLARPGAPPPAPRELACVVDGEHPGAARAAQARGFKTLKIKIGPDPTAQLPALLRLRDAVGPGVALRLDANLSFSPDRALAHLAALRALGPELVEDPCAELDVLARSPVPLALDEPLARIAAWSELTGLAASGGLAALVLKPAALGGIARALRYVERAERHGLDAIVSHLFDGPVAYAACSALALARGTARRATGLGPHAGLAAFPRVTCAGLDGPLLRPWVEPGFGIEPETVGAC